MRYSLWILALLAALAAGGCATSLTHAKIDPGDEERLDYVAAVTGAFRDTAGNVIVCVEGMPAGMYYLSPGPKPYSLRYPGANGPTARVEYHKAIPEYAVTAADVGGPCPETMAGWTRLPVRTAHAADFAEKQGDESWFGMSNEKLKRFVESDATSPAVYMFLYNPFGDPKAAKLIRIVYVSERPLPTGTKAVEIATNFRVVEPQPAYALLLPFALVYDVVTFPLQVLAAWAMTGG